MRRERMKKKKNMIIGGLLAVVFLMTVGYAAFASSLSINGTANTSSWIIKITNIREKTKTSGVTNKGTSYTDLTANFNCELTLPGDSITYEVTVENQGNIDASLKEVTKSFTNNKYIDVTYSGLYEGQMLYKQGAENSTAVMEVTVTFLDKDYEGTFTDTITSNISLNLNFEQEGNNIDTTKKYLVTYDSKGGTSVESEYYKLDDRNIGRKHIPIRTGYTFLGWYTRPNGGGKQADERKELSVLLNDVNDEGLTLYAKWTAKKYTINYDSQGGSDENSVSKFFWYETGVIGYGSSKLGYNFEGWYTKPNGQGKKITDTTTVGDVVQAAYGKYQDVAGGEKGDEVTLYAYWSEKEITIVFDNLDDEGTFTEKTVKWNESITLPSNPTKPGTTFVNWQTEPFCSGDSGDVVTNGMTPAQIASSDDDVYIFACWEEDMQ